MTDKEQTSILLKKYLDTGQLSEVEFLTLKTNAMKEGMFGDPRLLQITEAMERRQEQQANREFHSMLQVRPLTKNNDLLHSMSKVDVFSVTVVIALTIIAIGAIYPRLIALLKHSTRAVFLFLSVGFGAILWILR